ncbi:MAG: histidinol-phosphate transaminase [Rhodothermales bacterium]
MTRIETIHNTEMNRLLGHIRPAVRKERPYIVGTAPHVQVKLNQNECPLDLPEDLKRALLDEFFNTPFNRYPTEQPDRLCRALAEQVDWDPEGILVGNGSNELTYTFGLTLIEKGTPVVMPRPMFALYEAVVRLHEGALTPVAPRPDLRFDAGALLEAVRSVQPALVVLTTPNNPTGLAMPVEEIESIVREVPGFVVVDEAYVEFTEEESARTLLDDYPNLILLRTFSKAYGLAGLRLGYLIGHPPVVQELLKARLPFMVDRLAELTALALLERPALIRDRVQWMKRSCRKLTVALDTTDGVEVVPSQANFMIFKTPLEPKLLMNRLAGKNVLVRNMGGYPELRGYLRVNAGTPEENKAFLVALKEALS